MITIMGRVNAPPSAPTPWDVATGALVLGSIIASAFWWQIPWVPSWWAAAVQGSAAFSLADVLALATVCVGMASWARRRRPVRVVDTPLVAAGLAVVAAAIVGSPHAANVGLAAATSVHLVLLIGLYVVTAQGCVYPAYVCWALVAALALQIPVALLQVARQSTVPAAFLLSWQADFVPSMSGASVLLRGDGSRWLRAYGPFFHPNILGGYLAVELVALVALVAFDPAVSRSAPARMALGILAGLALGCLALSASRGGWASAGAGLGALWLLSRHRRRRTRVAPDAALAAAVAAVAVIAIFRPPLFERFAPLSNSLERRSVELRWQELQVAGALLVAHPVYGVGAGNGQLAAAQYQDGAFAAEPVHDVPLLMAVELGPLGVGAWVVVAGTILAATWRRPEPWPRTLAAALVAIGVAGVFDHYWWSDSSARDAVAILAGCWTAAFRPVQYRRGRNRLPACNEAPYCSPGRAT